MILNRNPIFEIASNRGGKYRSRGQSDTPGGHHRIRREAINRLVSADDTAGVRPHAGNTIVVVDDDPAIRKLFKRRLSQHGYRVKTVENGFAAGVFIYRHKPDLVLLDLFMEGIDGFEVCRTIKRDPTLTHIKVLAFSGVDAPEIKTRILAEGADGFLPKGVDFKRVRETIHGLLNPPQE